MGSHFLSLPELFPALGDGQAHGFGFFQGKVSPAPPFLCKAGAGQWTESARDMQHCPQQSLCVCGGVTWTVPRDPSKDPKQPTPLGDLGLAPQSVLAGEDKRSWACKCGSWGQPGTS